MTEVLGTDLLLLNRPSETKTYKIQVSDLPFPENTGGAAVYVGPSAPYAPEAEEANNGDLWWDTKTGVLYIYYVEDDENDNEYSEQWVQAASAYGAVSDLSQLNDVNVGNAPSNEEPLVYDQSQNKWVPGVVGSTFVDLQGVTNPFALAERVIGNLPEIDQDEITTQDKANEWFLEAIVGLEVRKLEASNVGIHPSKDDVLINGLQNFVGEGTSTDPIILSPNSSTISGGYELSEDTITFENQNPGSFVVFHDENHRSNGRRFDQDPGEIGNDGTYTTQLEYFDSPATTVNTTYNSLIKVGNLYFKWVVNQTGVNLSITSETVIDGEAHVYSNLHATPATVTGGSSTTSKVEWYSSDDGSSNWSFLGYEGTVYTVRESDETKFIKAVTVTTDTSGVQVSSDSNVVGPVDYGAISANNPIIVGSSIIGSTLTIIEGTVDQTSTLNITYQWFRDTDPIPGQIGLTYTLTDLDYDLPVSVQETIDDGHNVPLVKNSNSITGTYSTIVTNQCTLSGDGTPGQVLRVEGGDVVIGGSGSFNYTYKWYRDSLSDEIAGQTANTYTLTPTDNEKNVFCVKTATDTVTTTTRSSSSTRIYVSYNLLTSTTPGISGIFEDGNTLTAIPGYPQGGSGTYSKDYEWIVGGLVVGVGLSYVLEETDISQGSIILRETVNDDFTTKVVVRDSNPLTEIGSAGATVLNELIDVNVEGSTTGDILVKQGELWTYKSPIQLPSSFQFIDFIDVNSEAPDTTFTRDGVTYADLPAGSYYIQHKVSNGEIVSPTTFNDQWPDIPSGTSIEEGQYIVKGADGLWHIGGRSEGFVQSDLGENDPESKAYVKNKNKFVPDLDYGPVIGEGREPNDYYVRTYEHTWSHLSLRSLTTSSDGSDLDPNKYHTTESLLRLGGLICQDIQESVVDITNGGINFYEDDKVRGNVMPYDLSILPELPNN